LTYISQVLTASIIRAMSKPRGLIIALMMEAVSTSKTSQITVTFFNVIHFNI
jgi:hypothetical protein